MERSEGLYQRSAIASAARWLALMPIAFGFMLGSTPGAEQPREAGTGSATLADVSVEVKGLPRKVRLVEVVRDREKTTAAVPYDVALVAVVCAPDGPLEGKVCFVWYTLLPAGFPPTILSATLVWRSETGKMYAVVMSSASQRLPMTVSVFGLDLDSALAEFPKGLDPERWETWPSSSAKPLSQIKAQQPPDKYGLYAIEKVAATVVGDDLLIRADRGLRFGRVPPLNFRLDLTTKEWYWVEPAKKIEPVP